MLRAGRRGVGARRRQGADGVRAQQVTLRRRRFSVTLSDGSTITGEKLLVATGRAARLGDLGLDASASTRPRGSCPPTTGCVPATASGRVGDVTGNGAFTHMAMYEADVAVRDILGQGGPAADYRALPRVTFTDPEIGAVGLTEKQARDAGHRRAGRLT